MENTLARAELLDIEYEITTNQGNERYFFFKIREHGAITITGFWSGPLVRISRSTFFGPVRRSGIPDQQILVRSVGPEIRTGPTWSGKVVRNSGPDQFKSVRNSGPMLSRGLGETALKSYDRD